MGREVIKSGRVVNEFRILLTSIIVGIKDHLLNFMAKNKMEEFWRKFE